MKPSRTEMIERIVETELDGMDMESLIMYAEDRMYLHFNGKKDDYIQEVFDEMFENDLERVVDENYEDHKDREEELNEAMSINEGGQQDGQTDD